ncbi:glycogen branching enzyme [Gigaspora margarita]|uniref:Glycogen branching enzyme n=1 Tax=Gigaspora margarita TaxID=4874 RepID=A0A8H4AB80_GIGMA|nr:glycogen branching enzyme [Gigaspora margarita]
MASTYWSFWLTQQASPKTARAIDIDKVVSTGISNIETKTFDRIKGVKGIPLKIHIETKTENGVTSNTIEKAFAKVKLFRDKNMLIMLLLDIKFYLTYFVPKELMRLIDTAHGMGLYILLDIVHSHACKNVSGGLNMFDSSDHCYFHEGGKGNHDLWDSHYEVLRFLLLHLQFFIKEYKFDRFGFNGVTSMIFIHHSIRTGFSDDYHEYFGDSVDKESVMCLILVHYKILLSIHSQYIHVKNINMFTKLLEIKLDNTITLNIEVKLIICRD